MAEITRPQALVDVALAVALALVGGVAASVAGYVLMTRLGWPFLAVLVIQGLIILAGVHGLLAWRRQGWRRIGFRGLRPRDFGLAILALLAVFAVNTAMSVGVGLVAPELLDVHYQELSTFAGLLTGDAWLIVIAVIMLFTAFYEEVLARGFLLTRCSTLIKGTWGPVLVSSALFGLGHGYQGWYGMVQTAVVGIVFARLALHWGTLWPVILAHAALNTLSLAVLRTLGDV